MTVTLSSWHIDVTTGQGDAEFMSYDFTERREHPRVEVVRAIFIEVVTPGAKNDNEILRCETVDVSVGGLKLLVPEMNNGQLSTLLRDQLGVAPIEFNKVSGQPFRISELVERIGTLSGGSAA